MFYVSIFFCLDIYLLTCLLLVLILKVFEQNPTTWRIELTNLFTLEER